MESVYSPKRGSQGVYLCWPHLGTACALKARLFCKGTNQRNGLPSAERQTPGWHVFQQHATLGCGVTGQRVLGI